MDDSISNEISKKDKYHLLPLIGKNWKKFERIVIPKDWEGWKKELDLISAHCMHVWKYYSDTHYMYN
jgi:hypothetical protein